MELRDIYKDRPRDKYGIHEAEELCEQLIETGLSTIHDPESLTALTLTFGEPVFNLQNFLDDYNRYVHEGWLSWTRVGLLVFSRDMWMLPNTSFPKRYIYCYPKDWTYAQLIDPMPGQKNRHFVLHHNWQRTTHKDYETWSTSIIEVRETIITEEYPF